MTMFILTPVFESDDFTPKPASEMKVLVSFRGFTDFLASCAVRIPYFVEECYYDILRFADEKGRPLTNDERATLLLQYEPDTLVDTHTMPADQAVSLVAILRQWMDERLEDLQTKHLTAGLNESYYE